MNRYQHDHIDGSFSEEKIQEFIIIPMITKIEYIGQTFSYRSIKNGYFEERPFGAIDGMTEKQYFVFIVRINDTQCIFDFEKEALDFMDLLEKKLEDFYKNYSNYVTVMR